MADLSRPNLADGGVGSGPNVTCISPAELQSDANTLAAECNPGGGIYDAITQLENEINNLEGAWTGDLAAQSINDIIKFRNAMALFKTELGRMAVAANGVASAIDEVNHLRDGGTSLGSFTGVDQTYEGTPMEEVTAVEKVDIKPSAASSRDKLGVIVGSLQTDVVPKIDALCTKIFNNWTAGSNQAEFKDAVDGFMNTLKGYYTDMDNAKSNLSSALTAFEQIS